MGTCSSSSLWVNLNCITCWRSPKSLLSLTLSLQLSSNQRSKLEIWLRHQSGPIEYGRNRSHTAKICNWIRKRLDRCLPTGLISARLWLSLYLPHTPLFLKSAHPHPPATWMLHTVLLAVLIPPTSHRTIRRKEFPFTMTPLGSVTSSARSPVCIKLEQPGSWTKTDQHTCDRWTHFLLSIWLQSGLGNRHSLHCPFRPDGSHSLRSLTNMETEMVPCRRSRCNWRSHRMDWTDTFWSG